MSRLFEAPIFAQEVDKIAKETPNRVFGAIPRENWMQDGWQDLTFAQIAKSNNFMANWLDEKLGPAENVPTFAYFGPSDFRFAFLLGAGMKTKRKVLYPDILTLTGPGLQRLLETSECKHLLCAESHKDVFSSVAKAIPGARVEIVPSLDSCLNATNVPHYPFDDPYSEVLDTPFQIIHSSGTTGTPKIMTITHKVWSAYSEGQRYPVERGERLNSDLGRGKRLLVTFPFYWVVGLILTSSMVATTGVIPVLLPADTPNPVTAEFLAPVQERADIQGGIYAPSVLKDFCKSEDGVQLLRKLDFVWFSGAQLDKWTGDILCQHVQIGSLLGSSEGGGIPTYSGAREDYQYVRIHHLAGIRMEYREEDGLYEMVYDKRQERPQSVFLHFPHLEQHRTRDLYEQHPTKKDWFRHMGRLDDFVKLSHLDRFRGAETEQELEKHDIIKTALMGGDGRSKPFVLIETSQPDGGIDDDRNIQSEALGMVEDINQSAASQIRIPKELVIFSDSKRPFPRLAKGTLNRRATLALYDQDISNAYEAIEA